MHPIYLSSEFIGVLNKIKTISKNLPNKNQLLIFKHENTYRVSCMAYDSLLHITVDESHIKYDGDDCIGISDLSQFMKYLNNIEYSKGNGTIFCGEEKSTKGKAFTSFIFKGKYGTYRMVCADKTRFNPKMDMKIPSTRENNPLSLVAKIVLEVDELDQLDKDISLLSVGTFALTVENDISLFMRSADNSQLSKTFDETHGAIYDSYTTNNGFDNFKIFSTTAITFMAQFENDYEIELRVAEKREGKPMAFTAYTEIKCKDKSSMFVYIGANESKADSVTGMFDVIL